MSKEFKIASSSSFSASSANDNEELISNGVNIYMKLEICKEILDDARTYINKYIDMTNDEFRPYYVKELITFHNSIATLNCKLTDTFLLMNSLSQREKLDLSICINRLNLITRLNLTDSIYPPSPSDCKLFRLIGEELLFLIDKVVSFIVSLYKGRCFIDNDNYESCLNLKLYVRTLYDKITGLS